MKRIELALFFATMSLLANASRAEYIVLASLAVSAVGSADAGSPTKAWTNIFARFGEKKTPSIPPQIKTESRKTR